MLHNFFCFVLFETIHALPLLGALHLAGAWLYGISIEERNYDYVVVTPFQLYRTGFIFYLLTHAVRVVFCLCFEIAAKWLYMGRRQEGRYNW